MDILVRWLHRHPIIHLIPIPSIRTLQDTSAQRPTRFRSGTDLSTRAAWQHYDGGGCPDNTAYQFVYQGIHVRPTMMLLIHQIFQFPHTSTTLSSTQLSGMNALNATRLGRMSSRNLVGQRRAQTICPRIGNSLTK